MAYDSVRAQLDKLLGADRNGPLTAANQPCLSYTDSSVCKFFLLGFCPHDLHIKHRSEPGSCAKEHSSIAKAKFDKDKEEGKLKIDLGRWTRDLLLECRAILEDEERKIRGHARRLQDTYKTTGDLAGLMIRNFNTLKKLGMVSQDAKIRVLSEMDDFDPTVGFDDNENASETASQDPKERNAQKTNTKEAKHSPRVDEKTDHGDTTSDQDETGADDEDDDDDLDGFGVIKVIPADGGNDEKPASDPSHTTIEKEEAGTGDKKEVKGEAGGTNRRENKALNKNANDDKPEKEAENEPVKEKNAAKYSGDTDKTPQAAEDTAAPERDRNTMTDADEEQKSAVPNPEVSLAKSHDKMEEFYKMGKGPDGLLMLDRKQSLRVCACCGGFISLVDAESRLLSHYGGKSHHSLAQLREKVAELEKQVAADRRPSGDRFSRDFSRRRIDDRESTYSRRDDYRRDNYRRDDYIRDDYRRGERYSRNYDRFDRYRDSDRDSGRRGYGTTDWYDRSMRGRDDYGRDDRYRRHDVDHYRRERRGDRYESGRKRRRSRSPSYNRQRPRY